MLSEGKGGKERKKAKFGSFLSYAFNDVCFSPKCEDIIKIKISSSNIRAPKYALREQTVSIDKRIGSVS